MISKLESLKFYTFISEKILFIFLYTGHFGNVQLIYNLI